MLPRRRDVALDQISSQTKAKREGCPCHMPHLPHDLGALSQRLQSFHWGQQRKENGGVGDTRAGLPSLAWNTNLSFIFGKAKKVREKTAENLCARIFNATFNALQSGRRCRGDYDNSSLNSCLLSLSLSCRPS